MGQNHIWLIGEAGLVSSRSTIFSSPPVTNNVTRMSHAQGKVMSWTVASANFEQTKRVGRYWGGRRAAALPTQHEEGVTKCQVS